MNSRLSKRDVWTAIGLSAWAAGVADLAVTVMPVVRADKPLAPVLAAGRGVFGDPPATAGVGEAVLGVGAHFALMLMVAAIFVLAARKMSAIAARPLAFSLLYGVALSFLMPDHGPPPASALDTALAALRHVLCIGLPIGLITTRQLIMGRAKNAAAAAEPAQS